jgi:hypothetical protein
VENESQIISESDVVDEVAPAESAPSNLPLVITLIALLVFFGFETLQLFSERNNLRLVKGNQEGAIQESQKIQQQFKMILTKTSELADKGHAGAKLVVDELQKRGLEFTPEAKPEIPDAKAMPALK